MSTYPNRRMDPAAPLVLSRGDGWVGTYGITATAMLTDLLSDGVSIGAIIEHDDPDVEVIEGYTHPVCNVTDAYIHTEDGLAIDLEYVWSITIP